ncbi:hypothetical protein [uncultured Treponema sp.]|uniref:hypothetical protein n=1 Tax=uncultured Treponema sp. TaxID=162155 RepID=UPI0025E725E4|nr:hypothetical protein [uncultured Treponema sp.]
MSEFEKEQKICNPSSSSSEHGLMKKALEIKKTNKTCTSGLLSKITKSSLRTKNMTKAIVEQNGIFTIKENLETSSVKQDPGLKALVDSVLK